MGSELFSFQGEVDGLFKSGHHITVASLSEVMSAASLKVDIKVLQSRGEVSGLI